MKIWAPICSAMVLPLRAMEPLAGAGVPPWSRRNAGPITPLEAAGGTLLAIAYFVEWSVRGYLPFSSLRGIVPWYDAIPHIGLVLFVAGWWSSYRRAPSLPSPVAPASRGAVLGIVLFQAALVAANQPRVEGRFVTSMPAMSEVEAQFFPTPELQPLEEKQQ